jgi:hypothetical protein
MEFSFSFRKQFFICFNCNMAPATRTILCHGEKQDSYVAVSSNISCLQVTKLSPLAVVRSVGNINSYIRVIPQANVKIISLLFLRFHATYTHIQGIHVYVHVVINHILIFAINTIYFGYTYHSGNACYHSVQNLLSSHLLSKKLKN